jgi:hypothetical protein
LAGVLFFLFLSEIFLPATCSLACLAVVLSLLALLVQGYKYWRYLLVQINTNTDASRRATVGFVQGAAASAGIAGPYH